jgi:hypothetical protein
MFWTIVGGLFALVLLAAWLSDRRAKQRHGAVAMTEQDRQRQGSAQDLSAKTTDYCVGGERNFGGVGGPAGGSPLGG